ncbi:type II secretion system F family protein [Clostridium magnum]|uniref:type II secretion system F family protein n=1 Tax=Clostridium magnum TaxID=33954 RepID=UPI001FA83E83|nr:type II secretion system F family protein [Clostridium magnum]
MLDLKMKRKSFKGLFYKKVTFQDLSVFCNGLSTMIDSGISISQAFSIIRDLNNKKQIKESLYEIDKSVSKGETIYLGMKRFSGIYPTFMIEMIKLGEESGNLDEVLKKLSQYYEKRSKISVKIKTLIIYPMLVFVTSIFMIIFVMMKIIPQFMEILNCSGGELPIITRFVLFFYTFIKTNIIQINIVLFSFIGVIYIYSNTPGGRTYLDSLKMKIPLFNKFYNKLIISRFSISMGILVSSGVIIVKALEITQSILLNKVVERKVMIAAEDIKKGESIYYSFRKQRIGDDLFLALVKTGEESGNLDNMLLKAGEIFEDDVAEILKKVIALIEPITILFLAFFIGAFVIAALMPVFSIMDSIG